MTKTHYTGVREGAAGAGATVWWRLSGETARQPLVDACNARKIERLPTLIDPETALGRAAGTLRGKLRKLVQIRRGAWAVVEVQIDLSRDAVRAWDGPTVVLDKIGRPVFSGATAAEADAVRGAYEHHLEVLETTDVSAWLTESVLRCGASSLRDGGGIYYLPPAALPQWGLVVEALAEASEAHTVYSMATVADDAGMRRAVLDALTAEVRESVAKIRTEVIGGDLGLRALENRRAQSRLLRGKLGQYEGVLGDGLAALQSALTTLDEDIVAATLASEAVLEEQGA